MKTEKEYLNILDESSIFRKVFFPALSGVKPQQLAILFHYLLLSSHYQQLNFF